MIALTLRQIADIVGGELRTAGTDTETTIVSGAVETDSREIAPGGIFIAKPGAETDGHRFVPTAVAAGAVLAVVEHQVPVEVSQIVVPSAVGALASLARVVVERVRGAGRLRVIGITGSNGKTTTKALLAAILSGEGETVAPRGSFNNEVGAPLTMLRITDDTRFLVSELGASAPGEIAALAELIVPDIAVVLMVGKAHAGGFGDLDTTVRTKAELLHATRRGGVAVLNRDDPRVAGMAAIADERDLRVVWFSKGGHPSAYAGAHDITITAEGTLCTIVIDGATHDLRLRVLGEHSVSNALAALAAATALGVPVTRAVAVLESIDLAERWRMQPLGSDRVRIINDAYNASPDSMAAALRTLAQITRDGERTVAVLGAMSELGEAAGEEHDRIGELAVRLRIQKIVVVGREARRLFLAAIAEGSWGSEAQFFETADEAYEWLRSELRDGDRVLVKSSNAAGLRHLGDRLGEVYA